MQTDFMGPLLAPSNYTNLVASKSIEQTTKTNENTMGMFSFMRDTVLNNLTTLYNVFGNMGITLQYMVQKLKSMMNKMSGVYKATYSTMQTSAITAQSTWDALPGQLLRALPH
jgi:hypothetical protein